MTKKYRLYRLYDKVVDYYSSIVAYDTLLDATKGMIFHEWE
jgi:hypothetical protein